MNDPVPVTLPRAAVGLGYLAVLPFVGAAALAWIVEPTQRPLAAQILSAYAAVVVSFIGAIHWGLAFPQPRPAPALFVWGVIPSIVMWIAVLLQPPLGLVVEAAMLVACYGVDRRVYPREGVARWLPLRLRLTVCATAACVAGAAAAWHHAAP